MYQITSASNINSKRLAGYMKNKYENIVYKNYNNSQINIARCKSVNTTMGSKIWDIVVKFFKTRSESMTLLITK